MKKNKSKKYWDIFYHRLSNATSVIKFCFTKGFDVRSKWILPHLLLISLHWQKNDWFNILKNIFIGTSTCCPLFRNV